MNYMLICFGLFSLAATDPLTISRSDIALDSEQAASSIIESVSNDKEKRGVPKTQSDSNVPYTYTQPQYISAHPELIQPPSHDAYSGPTIQAQHIHYIPPSQQQTFVTPVPHSQPQTKYQYVKPTVSTIPQQQLYIAPPSPTQYVFFQPPTHHQPSSLAPVSSASSLSQYYVPSSHSLGLPVSYSMQPIIMMLIPANHVANSASNLHYYVAPRSLPYPAVQSYLLPSHQHMSAATQPVTYVLQPTLSQTSSVPAQQITTNNNVKSQTQYNQVKG